MKQIFTPKDAAIILRYTPIDIKSTREDDIHTIYATAMMMAIEVLEDFDKFRWHDIRKDQEDLPKIGENVLTCGLHHGYEVIKFRGARHSEKYGSLWDWKKNTIKKVIAWRYIEPFGG